MFLLQPLMAEYEKFIPYSLKALHLPPLSVDMWTKV